jgi:hypothetical protein
VLVKLIIARKYKKEAYKTHQKIERARRRASR